MNYLFFLIFGIAPSLIWLLFYLRQDDHPEPRRMILKVFFWGMLSTIPALAAELVFREALRVLPFQKDLLFVLAIAFAEEIAKFFVVYWLVYSNKELDEPVDLMIYMVISALGFSAFENIILLFGSGQLLSVGGIAALAFVRFLGATFLHALASSILGYFLALSFFFSKSRLRLALTGFTLAILLHGFFDFTILTIDGPFRFWGPFIIFIITILFMSFAIARLKRIKSVCTI